MDMSSVIALKTSYCKKKTGLNSRYFFYMLAGVTGIEPVNGEFRVHCLTAWLHPNIGITKTGLADINELR